MRQAQALAVLAIGLAFPSIAAAGTPTIVSWQSRHLHTGGVPYELDLDPSKTSADTGRTGPTCDPRLGGHIYILVRFNEAVKPSDGTLDRHDVSFQGWNANGTHTRTPEAIFIEENGTLLRIYFGNGLNELSR